MFAIKAQSGQKLGGFLGLTGQPTFPNQWVPGQREASCHTNQPNKQKMNGTWGRAPKAVLWFPISSCTRIYKHTHKERVCWGREGSLRLWCQIQKWSSSVGKEKSGLFLLYEILGPRTMQKVSQMVWMRVGPQSQHCQPSGTDRSLVSWGGTTILCTTQYPMFILQLDACSVPLALLKRKPKTGERPCRHREEP